jgi:hypothetical protein
MLSLIANSIERLAGRYEKGLDETMTTVKESARDRAA